MAQDRERTYVKKIAVCEGCSKKHLGLNSYDGGKTYVCPIDRKRYSVSASTATIKKGEGVKKDKKE